MVLQAYTIEQVDYEMLVKIEFSSINFCLPMTSISQNECEICTHMLSKMFMRISESLFVNLN